MLGFKQPTTGGPGGVQWRNRKCKNLAALSTDSQLAFPRQEALDLTSRGQGTRSDDMLHVILGEGLGQLVHEKRAKLAILSNEAADRLTEITTFLGLNPELVSNQEFSRIKEACRGVCVKYGISTTPENMNELAIKLNLATEKPWEAEKRKQEADRQKQEEKLKRREQDIKRREELIGIPIENIEEHSDLSELEDDSDLDDGTRHLLETLRDKKTKNDAIARERKKQAIKQKLLALTKKEDIMNETQKCEKPDKEETKKAFEQYKRDKNLREERLKSIQGGKQAEKNTGMDVDGDKATEKDKAGGSDDKIIDLTSLSAGLIAKLAGGTTGVPNSEADSGDMQKSGRLEATYKQRKMGYILECRKSVQR